MILPTALPVASEGTLFPGAPLCPLTPLPRGPTFFLIYLSVFREGGGERESSICCSTYLCIHWLILTCTLARDGTHNLSYGDDTLTSLATQTYLEAAWAAAAAANL